MRIQGWAEQQGMIGLPCLKLKGVMNGEGEKGIDEEIDRYCDERERSLGREKVGLNRDKRGNRAGMMM